MTGQRLSVRVYSAGSRWVWVVQEFGATLVSGTGPDKATAQARARHARAEIAAVTPGGLVGQHEKRVGRVRINVGELSHAS